ncbi:MAG: hypothetical protein AABW67_03710 [Nanoarchaeota archaeon]
MEIKEFCSISADKTFAKNAGLPKPLIKYKDNYLLDSRRDFN